MDEPVRFFVGCDPRGGDAECMMAFEYSVMKNCSRPYSIVWMAISNDTNSFWNGWNTSNWSTTFSGFRWGIPEYSNFEGKAIYCDSDQLWLSDPVELWENPFEEGKVAQAKLLHPGDVRYCVMLWDNTLPDIEFPSIGEMKGDPDFHQKMIASMSKNNLVQYFDRNFNNFDGEDQAIEDIKLLHFTDMSSNPGVHMAIERMGRENHWYDGPIREHRRPEIKQVFEQYYQEAIDAGLRIEDYILDPDATYSKGSQANYRAGHEWESTS